MVILNSRGSNLKTRASAATAALAFVGTPFLFALSYMEHDRTVHPSSLLTLYLSLAVLLNSVRLRTLWLSQNATQIAGVFTGIITLEFFALVLEVMSKRRILRPKYTPFSEEGTSGIISRNLFWWANPLFRRGYRQELALEDLPVLEKHFDSRYLQELIRANWSKCQWPPLSPAYPFRFADHLHRSGEKRAQRIAFCGALVAEMAPCFRCHTSFGGDRIDILSTLFAQQGDRLRQRALQPADEEHRLRSHWSLRHCLRRSRSKLSGRDAIALANKYHSWGPGSISTLPIAL